MDTLTMVKKIISQQLNKPVEKILPESKIVDDLGADSLDVVEMTMSLEETFNLSIPDESNSSIVTVKDIVDFIDSQKK